MISLDQLEFGYGRADLFRRLNLKLEAGTIYGLLGRNGAGKTTLLKIITGLLSPRSGSVSVYGLDPRKRPSDLLADIYLVPEEFHTPALTVDQYESIWGPFYPHFDGPAFRRYLTEFQVAAGIGMSSMSYGQKKKALLAFALATNCRLVLLDEPTNGLDIPAKRQFRRLVAGAAGRDRTFIVSTHQVRDMEGLIDPVLIIDDGRIVLDAGLAELGKVIRIDTDVDTPPENAIYAEEGLSGHTVVMPNTGGAEEGIDLEVLFNAATSVSDRLATLLQESSE